MQTTTTPLGGEPKSEEPPDLFVTVHERVLGVDIVVHQEAIYNKVHHGKHWGGLEPDAFPKAVGDEARCSGRNRRYIAAWARRNLFDGAGPR